MALPMNLFVNGSKRTKLTLIGRISLITDDIVAKLFDMKIKREDFIVDNLKFEVYEFGNFIENKIMFLVSEV